MNTRISTTTNANVISCVVLGVILFLLLHAIGLIVLEIAHDAGLGRPAAGPVLVVPGSSLN